MTGFGVEHGTTWTPIEQLKTKLVYSILMKKRMKLKGYSPRKAHQSIDAIQKQLSASGERDDWPYFDQEDGEQVEAVVDGPTKLIIVAARWIYHCERCNIDHGKRRRMTLNIVMQKLHRRLGLAEKAIKID